MTPSLRGLAAATILTACGAQPSPNVVLIIVDDLGWADLGFAGSTFYETPNIDQLAVTAVRFSNFYAASPVCSPTRASLMTGRHPARLHITNWIGGEQQGRLLQAEYDRALPLAEQTIAEVFRDAGYATGFVGKWHLGGKGFQPQQQGFEVNVAGHAAGQPGSYFYPYENERLPWSNVPDLGGGGAGEYLTDRLTTESIDFITREARNPFLLVLSYYAVHTPLEAKADVAGAFARKAAQGDSARFVSERDWGTTRLVQNHAVYAGMVHSVDENVGRILATLDSLRLDDRTVVVLVSDNGGLSTLAGDRRTAPTSNAPLRAGKGWLYEGGIRAPLLIRAPGVAPNLAEVPATSDDLLPTMLALARLTPDLARPLDGMSLAPVLSGRNLDRNALYWHFPHYHGSGNRPSGAIRQGSFKLIEWFETGEVELYDLAHDAGETRNLASSLPDSAASLRRRLAEWRTAVGARMPAVNPDWRVSN